jgi:hypothetical protein
MRILERATGCQWPVTLVHICDIWTMKLKVMNYGQLEKCALLDEFGVKEGLEVYMDSSAHGKVI